MVMRKENGFNLESLIDFTTADRSNAQVARMQVAIARELRLQKHRGNVHYRQLARQIADFADKSNILTLKFAE